jgi:uncharacterized protein with NAD-binding domain and iron-sulfur cluster
MSAVWALTEAPDWQERLEITVYQLGWRLGGKGASGRNAARGQRIEEHGLHIWLGWYDNAFSLLRKCYAELGRPADAPLARLEEAFVAHDFVGVAHDAASHWRKFWMVDFPRTARRVGDGEPTRLHEHLIVALKLVARHLNSSQLRPIRPETPRDDGPAAYIRPTLMTGAMLRLLRSGSARLLARLDAVDAPAARLDVTARLLESLRRRLAGVVAGTSDSEDELRGLQVLLDFVAATLHGLVRDRALLFGLDVLDEWDLREWLARHGARPETLAAPFIKAWYDLAFAYEDGDTTRPNFAAGAALRAILRTGFTYKGAVFWKMRAGMGDVVFAPLYEVLRRRGVRFEFFHRVDELEVEPFAPSRTSLDRHRVSRVRMTIQATPHAGIYTPLVDVGGLPCWPSAPRHDQLVEGERLAREDIDLECPWSAWPGVGAKVLERGRDFDDVIFGISLGAVAHLCPGLVARDPAWRRMVDRVKTVATQAVQLWLEPTLEELGWRHPSPVLDAYDDPFNTWADMSFLLEREAWSGSRRPGTLAYLVGPLHEHEPPPPPGAATGFQARQVQAVRARVQGWLDRAATGIWPATARVGTRGFDTTKLFTESTDPRGEPLADQYARANVAGSERYVQSLRGSTRHRLFAAASGVASLYLAGDWLNTGINSGDVEAATIAGLQAARAVLGSSTPISGEGDGWHRHRLARRIAAPPRTGVSSPDPNKDPHAPRTHRIRL